MDIKGCYKEADRWCNMFLQAQYLYPHTFPPMLQALGPFFVMAIMGETSAARDAALGARWELAAFYVKPEYLRLVVK